MIHSMKQNVLSTQVAAQVTQGFSWDMLLQTELKRIHANFNLSVSSN